MQNKVKIKLIIPSYMRLMPANWYLYNIETNRAFYGCITRAGVTEELKKCAIYNSNKGFPVTYYRLAKYTNIERIYEK